MKGDWAAYDTLPRSHARTLAVSRAPRQKGALTGAHRADNGNELAGSCTCAVSMNWGCTFVAVATRWPRDEPRAPLLLLGAMTSVPPSAAACFAAATLHGEARENTQPTMLSTSCPFDGAGTLVAFQQHPLAQQKCPDATRRNHGLRHGHRCLCHGADGLAR